jgi:hypothetical protein
MTGNLINAGTVACAYREMVIEHQRLEIGKEILKRDSKKRVFQTFRRWREVIEK